jgi:hypothetical protein
MLDYTGMLQTPAKPVNFWMEAEILIARDEVKEVF